MATSPEIRLKRYLCYTNEANIYYPGCRFLSKRYTLESVPSLGELLAENKVDYIFSLIQTLHEERRSCYPDALLFVLSELARDKPMRERALKQAELLCEKAESFVTFLKFSLEGSPKTGFGRSFRRFVRNWYTNKDKLLLAEIVGDLRKFRGWTHGDIMKLAHVKSTEPAKAATFTYAVKGFEAMKTEHGEKEEAKQVIDYLLTVETFRKKQDAVEVAAKIESYMLGFHHINFLLHADKRIWLALLRQMPVLQVLQHFQFMSKKKMFRNNRSWDFVFVDTIVEALTKPFANRTGISTSRVFIELMNYENAGKVKLELANRLKHTAKKPPMLNTDIQAAFITLMDTTFESLKPSGKRIMIAIEHSQEMIKRRCSVSRYITLSEAAVYIAYYFNKYEPNVKAYTFNSTCMKAFNISKDTSIKVALDNMRTETLPENPQGPKSKGDEFITTWLRDHGCRGGPEEVDVCIILKCYLDNNSLHSLSTGTYANKKMKFIVSDLCGIPKNSKPPDKRNLFVTSGFDEKLTQAMSLYINDVF